MSCKLIGSKYLVLKASGYKVIHFTVRSVWWPLVWVHFTSVSYSLVDKVTQKVNQKVLLIIKIIEHVTESIFQLLNCSILSYFNVSLYHRIHVTVDGHISQWVIFSSRSGHPRSQPKCVTNIANDSLCPGNQLAINILSWKQVAAKLFVFPWGLFDGS